MRLALVDRLWAHVDPEPNTGCWIWLGAKTHDGYGHLRVNGRMQKAHRISWVQAKGPIPDGLCVLHSCDIRLCINPDHLFLGTKADNTADMLAKGRNVPGKGRPLGLPARAPFRYLKQSSNAA